MDKRNGIYLLHEFGISDRRYIYWRYFGAGRYDHNLRCFDLGHCAHAERWRQLHESGNYCFPGIEGLRVSAVEHHCNFGQYDADNLPIGWYGAVSG